MVEPVSPIVWPASGWVSSIAPLPFQVVTTGAPSRSASARSSAEASARDHAAAGHDDRALRLGQQRGRALDVVGIRPRPAARLALRRVGERHLGRLGLDVHRHVEQDRSGPAGGHRVPGAMEDERQLIDARRLPPLLDDRLEDARVVGRVPPLELLEQRRGRACRCAASR